MTTSTYDSLTDFTLGSFTYQDKTKPLYRKGSGPGVVIIHEIPGITPQVADFARRVAEAGFTTVLPVLFGTPGKPMTTGYTVGVIDSSPGNPYGIPKAAHSVLTAHYNDTVGHPTRDAFERVLSHFRKRLT